MHVTSYGTHGAAEPARYAWVPGDLQKIPPAPGQRGGQEAARRAVCWLGAVIHAQASIAHPRQTLRRGLRLPKDCKDPFVSTIMTTVHTTFRVDAPATRTHPSKRILAKVPRHLQLRSHVNSSVGGEPNGAGCQLFDIASAFSAQTGRERGRHRRAKHPFMKRETGAFVYMQIYYTPVALCCQLLQEACQGLTAAPATSPHGPLRGGSEACCIAISLAQTCNLAHTRCIKGMEALCLSHGGVIYAALRVRLPGL